MLLRRFAALRFARLAVLAAVLGALPALAKVVDGTTFPDTVEVAGTKLTLNGVGARTALFMRFYLAALYTETKSTDVATLLAADRPREVRLVLVKKVEQSRFREATQAGFEKNSASLMPALKDRLRQFQDAVPTLDSGDTLTFTYEPGKGTRIYGKHVKELVIPGKDFADALWSVWLGKHPVDDDLKKGVLGVSSL